MTDNYSTLRDLRCGDCGYRPTDEDACFSFDDDDPARLAFTCPHCGATWRGIRVADPN